MDRCARPGDRGRRCAVGGMTPTELKLSWMLWLCIGFLIGYRYHVLRVRDIQARRIKRIIESWRDRALDKLLADVALRCIERPTNVRCN